MTAPHQVPLSADYKRAREVVQGIRLNAPLVNEGALGVFPKDALLLCDVYDEMQRSLPDDIRARGWTVAVHNDYRQDGKPHTFWLFTKGGRAVKGEGPTDAEALDEVRKALGE